MNAGHLLAELKRRNVLRAGAIYAAAVWALAQGIAQLQPVVGAPEWITRGFLIAASIGFPFWLVFAWVYEFTPQGLKRESATDPAGSVARRSDRRLDRWIIAVMTVAIVLLLTDRLTARKDVREAGTAASVHSIAVLPLANESGDRGEQYFSDGLSEDLITALSQFDGLKVISRNSSFRFRGTHEDSRAIGGKLGVTHLLEGSVRRIGNEVRVTAELVNVADGSALWSQRYDRPYADLFKLQDDITHVVASALRARLLSKAGAVAQSDRPSSGSLEAWNAYLRGSFHIVRGSEADTRKAIAQYDAAIAIDPSYARAHAALAEAWARLGATFLGDEDQRHAYANANAAADEALRLDPELAAAHSARGYLRANAEFDWSAAEVDYRRALQLAPHDGAVKYGFGSLLASLGQAGHGAELIGQALATDPQHGAWYYGLSLTLPSLDRLDEAERAILMAIELQPGGAANHEQLAIIRILRGDAAAALDAAHDEPDELWRNCAVALALQIGADRAAADAALAVLVERQASASAYQIAEVYALRADSDNVFRWLDRAWQSRDPGLSWLLVDPLLLRFSDDPRFAAFCRKAGLPLPGGKPAVVGA